MIQFIVLFSSWFLLIGIAIADPTSDYQEHCQECHGVNRLGGQGPALIPETWDAYADQIYFQ